MIGHGSLHLLDFGDYPETPHPPFAPSAFGFPPGLTSRAPVEALLYWTFQGIHWTPLYLLPFATVAPLACVGFARLFPANAPAIGAATVLFTVNPFVYQRMASGQVYVVMGYSFLPILLALVVRPFSSLAATAALGGLVFTLDVAVSVHYLFISGVLLGIVVIVHLACRQVMVVRTGAAIAICAAVMNLYWLIPAAHASRTMQSHVTKVDLSVFQTLGDRTWGLAVNVAGLYGFWRLGPPLVKDQISGWPFLLLAILLIAVFGCFEIWAGGATGRALALSCVAVVAVGSLLAAGSQGPTGNLYSWLFEHLAGFKVMREADKFSALVALGYSACFGAGIAALVRVLTEQRLKILCVCCAAALPVLYGYTELWGFDGYARLTDYPASWVAADRSMSPGAAALALPWRSYVRVPWDGNRVVDNPIQGYFARPIISGDDLEAGSITTETSDPRSLFLQFCLSEGNRLSDFGRLLAPLGIRYVILAKVPGAQSFDWLGRQRDLRRIFESGSVSIYRNEESVPDAYEPLRRIMLQNWGQVVALAQQVPLTSYLIDVRAARPGPLEMPAIAAVQPPIRPKVIQAVDDTPVSESVDLPGSTRTIVLTHPAYEGWRMARFRATSQFGVTVAFTRSRSLGHRATLAATYGPWRLVAACDIIGACLVGGDMALMTAAFFRHGRRGLPGAPPRAGA
ncbi:MAG: hypothetical protein ACLPKI_31075 [Streptosporangiaceae bacterium]